MDLSLILIILLHILNVWPFSTAIKEVLVAINAGGPEHTDTANIKYQADPLRQGIVSDYGRRYLIGRAHLEDQILYQTERYNIGNFEYILPVDKQKIKDGDYVLVLKFSEVYFNAAKEKTFSVSLNDHMIVSELDIYAKVGKAIAYDEIVPFSIKNQKLTVVGETSEFDGIFTLNFIQGDHDNPKINAFYIMHGTTQDVPPMPELETSEEDEFLQKREEQQLEEQEDEEPESRAKYASGPQISDPYAQQEVSQMFIPILVALACFFPILFCLCRL